MSKPKARTAAQTIDRRQLVLAGGGGAALIALFGIRSARAQDKSLADEAIAKILGAAKPVEGKLVIDMPEIAENGNTVPFSVAIESPMTAADHVKAIHVFATGNPTPAAGTFRFTPASGRATVASRMRLAKTQDIVTIAELSNGSFLMAKRTVKVTIGGCGG